MRTQTKRPNRRYLLFFLAICGLSLFLSPPNLHTEPVQGEGNAAPIKSTEQLTVSIGHVLPAVMPADAKVGIAAKNLDTGETYNLNADQQFDGASTTKIGIAAFMYEQAAGNLFDLDQVVTISPSEVQHYGTGSIQNEPGPYRYSYRELAQKMMHESDNTAAYVLANRLDKEKLQAFYDAHGLTETKVDGNQTSASDMLPLIEKLYRNELTDPELTKELLGYMQHTEFEDRIPARLPNDAVIYHKTGDALDGGLHDVGVVEYKGHHYAVAIYSKGLSKSQIADISKSIFSYETR